MKLSKKQRARVLNIALADIQRADDFFTEKVEPILKERQNIYTASKDYYEQKFPRLSEQTDIVSYDMWSTVQWAKAPILSAFFGGDEIVNIVGREAEDADRGSKMKKLIEFQLLKLNSGFVKFGQWVDDAMALEIGVIKAWWNRETDVQEHTELLPPYRLEEMTADPNIEIVSVSDPDEFGDVVVKYTVSTVTVNQPVVELVRPTDIRWTPGARTLEEANFVAQRKVVTADHLRRKANQGIYDKKAVTAAIEAGEDPDYVDFDIDINPELEDKDDNEEAARRRLQLYECYTKIDVDEDGLLEDVIVTICGGQLLRAVENSNGRIPFFMLSPNKDPYKVVPDLGFPEVIGELQHLKTAMLRQVVVNLALNNQPRNYVDDVKVNMDDLIEDRQYIRVHGNPNQAIYTQAIQPIAAWTMPFFEYIETLLEQWTGRTRYNQGLDAKSLNKTASGMSMIMKASTQRLGQIIRQFAETGVGELYRYLIKLNQKYITQDQVIRLMNEEIEISLDDLSGKLDIDVNIDIGIGEKQQTIQNLQLFLGMLFPQGQAMGILTPKEWIMAARKILMESGIRNINDYVPDPQQYEQRQQQQQMQQQMMGGMGGMPPGMPPQGGGMPGGPAPRGEVQGGNPAGQGGGILKGLPPELAGIASGKFAQGA